MVLPMTLVASAGQVVDFTDLTRQTAGYHVDMINPGAPTPLGDYSSPVFGSQPVSGCFSGSQDRTTSYGSPSDINLDLIAWTRTCFTKVQENGGSTAPLSMDVMPNGDQFTMTYPFDGLGADDFAPDAPDDLLVFSFDLPGDVLDPSYCSGASTQVALGFQTGGPEFAAGSSFPDDYFGGAGRITTIDINDCSMSATDFIFNGSGLDVFPGNTLAAIGPNGSGGSIISGITRVPTGFTGVRPVIFHTNQTGNFDPSVVGHVWPSGGTFYNFSDVVCLNDLEFASPTTTTLAPSTTQAEPTTTAEATTTVEATTTTVEATTTTVAVSDPGDTGGGFPWIFLIVLLAIALLIWWYFFGRKPGRYVGRTRVRTGGGDDGGTPVSSVPRDHVHECDWAFYVNTGSNRMRVRDPKAGAHECCVYELAVTSFVHRDEVVAKERQDLAEVGRERASVGGTSIAGVDVGAKAGVRSWPYGEQGAMHGRGDISEWPTVGPTPGPWPEYWQERQYEEQLDTAFSARLHQDTRVKVTFTDGCGASDHGYTYDSSSTAKIFGTAECTNENHLPTCPVELTASALAQVVAKGDLWYEVNAKSFTATDELPPKIVAAGPNAEFRRAEADGHRHDNDRERDSWEVLDTGADAGIMPGKTWSSTYVNIIEADAGLMIPQAMWPTTDRVTALVDCDVSSELDLSRESDTGHSKSSSCCADGGAACLCEPSFQLVVGPGNLAKLTVDGNTIMLSNSDPSSTQQTIFWD